MAHAAPATDNVLSVTVKFSDLDLATDAGASKLYSRIATAAHVVCPGPDSRDLQAIASSKSCEAEAIARAVRKVQSPRLAVKYSALTNNG